MRVVFCVTMAAVLVTKLLRGDFSEYEQRLKSTSSYYSQAEADQVQRRGPPTIFGIR